MSGTTRINYVLNWLIFFDIALVMLSGLLISRAVMPTLGIALPENFAWRSLHDLSANLCILLLGVHTALHWSWIADTFSRYIFQPFGRLFSAKSKKDVIA